LRTPPRPAFNQDSQIPRLSGRSGSPTNEISLHPSRVTGGGLLDRGELDEFARVQFGDLVDPALLDEVGGVKRPGGVLVVEGGGGVEGGAVEEEVELGLAGGPSPVVGEAVDDVFEDEAVVGEEEVGDGAGGGGEGGGAGVGRGVGGGGPRRWRTTVSVA